jgi:acyl carrier protein
MDIESRIRRFVAETLLFSGNGFDYSDDASFLDSGMIDSMGVMDLVTFVQSSFGLDVEPEHVTPENFDSVARLARYIRGQRAAAATGQPSS